MDCKVLMDRYEVLRTWTLEHTQLVVDNSITIQSMAFTYMLKICCYRNVYQISGTLQQFTSNLWLGGRAICNSNKQYHVKKK